MAQNMQAVWMGTADAWTVIFRNLATATVKSAVEVHYCKQGSHVFTETHGTVEDDMASVK